MTDMSVYRRLPPKSIGDFRMIDPLARFSPGFSHLLTRLFVFFAAFFATFFASGQIAIAQSAGPKPGQIWHPEPASQGMEDIVRFDVLTFWIIIPITLFVFGLLFYAMVRFRASANPEPSTVTHNTTIEIIWTLAPILILLVIAVPSFKLLSSQFNPPQEPSLTIKATGYQWYWEYEYQDDSQLSFESRPIGVAEISGSEEAAQQERLDLGKTDLNLYPRLLAVDNELVVPLGQVIRVLVTADDVIHDFAMPVFGLKMDGLPGRINEVFFQPNRTGLFYGQCSELCGKYHAYMPIAVRVVEEREYEDWLRRAADDLEEANRALAASL